GEALELGGGAVNKDDKGRTVLEEIHVFLLLPRGINSLTPDKEAVSTFGQTTLHRYPGMDGYNFFLGGDKGQLTMRQFQQEVRGALRGYSQRAHGRDLNSPEDAPLTPLTRQPFAPRGEKVAPIKLEALTLDEPATLKDPYR